jgi:hypothetical protein
MIWEFATQVDHIQAIQRPAASSTKINNTYGPYYNNYTMTFETRDRANWRTMPQDLITLLSLQNTCRQVRSEVGALPFSHNLFDVSLSALQHFLTVVPKKVLDEIKVITIHKVPGPSTFHLREWLVRPVRPTSPEDIWREEFAELRRLPALEKVFMRLRGFGHHSHWNTLMFRDIRQWLPQDLERDVEVVAI